MSGLEILPRTALWGGWGYKRKTREMNRVIAILGCVAVLSAFLLGPFTHIHHVDDLDSGGSEEAAFVHSHISFDNVAPPDSQGTTVSRPGHSDSHEISVFDLQKASAAQQPLLVAFSFEVPELAVEAHLPPCLRLWRMRLRGLTALVFVLLPPSLFEGTRSRA